MNSGRKSVRVGLIIQSILLAFFLGGGCSTEEQYEDKRAKRVVRIKTPPKERDLAPERDAGISDKKSSLKNVLSRSEVKRASDVVQGGPSRPGETRKKEIAHPKETSSSSKTASPSVLKEKRKPAGEKRSEPEKARETGANRYRVKRGDTLFKIAGRKNVYDDPMKWPNLFRLNMDKLGKIKTGDRFQYKGLPEGIELEFTAPSEAMNNLDKLGRRPWVVNVMSVQDPIDIGPTAVVLMKKGYRVYLAKARVKGKDWIRVRVGFFKNSAEADAVRKKILPMVNDAWLAKIGDRELKRFGGY